MSFDEVDEEIRRVFKYSTVREAEKFLVNLDHDVIESRSTLKKLIKGSFNDLIDLCDKLNGIDKTCEEIVQIQGNISVDAQLMRQPLNQEQNHEKLRQYKSEKMVKESNSQDDVTHLQGKESKEIQNLNEKLIDNNVNYNKTNLLSEFVNKIQKSLVEVDVALQCHQLREAANTLFELHRKLEDEEKIHSEENSHLQQMRSKSENTVQCVEINNLNETMTLYAEEIEKAVLDEMLSSSALLTEYNLQTWLEHLQHNELNSIVMSNNTNESNMLTNKYNEGSIHTKEFVHSLRSTTSRENEQMWEYIAYMWSSFMEIIALTSKCKDNKYYMLNNIGNKLNLHEDIGEYNNKELKQEEVREDSSITREFSFQGLLEKLRQHVYFHMNEYNAKNEIGKSYTVDKAQEKENVEVDSFLSVIARLLLHMMTSVSSTKENETTNNKIKESIKTKEQARINFANIYANFLCKVLHEAHQTQLHVQNKLPSFLSERTEKDLSQLHLSLTSSSTISSLYGIMHIHFIIKLTEQVLNTWCELNQRESNASNIFVNAHNPYHTSHTKLKEDVWSKLLQQEEEKQAPTLFTRQSNLTHKEVDANILQRDKQRQISLPSTNKEAHLANEVSLPNKNNDVITTTEKNKMNVMDNLLWGVHCAIQTEINEKDDKKSVNRKKKEQEEELLYKLTSKNNNQVWRRNHNIRKIKSHVEEFVINFAIPCQNYLLIHYAYHPLLLSTFAVHCQYGIKSINTVNSQEKQNIKTEGNLKEMEKDVHKIKENVDVVNIDTHLGERLKAQLVRCITNALNQTDILLDVFLSHLTTFTSEKNNALKEKCKIPSSDNNQQKNQCQEDLLYKASVGQMENETAVHKCSNYLHNGENAYNKVYESSTMKRINARRAWLMNEKTTLPSIKELQEFMLEIGQMCICNKENDFSNESAINEINTKLNNIGENVNSNIQSTMNQTITDEQLIYAMAKYDKLQRAINALILSSEYANNNNNNNNEEEKLNSQEARKARNNNIHHSNKRTVLNKLVSFAEVEQGQWNSSQYFGVNDFFFSGNFTNCFSLNKIDNMILDKESQTNATVWLSDVTYHNANASVIVNHVKTFMNAKFIQNKNVNDVNKTIQEGCTLDDLKVSLVVIFLQIYNVFELIYQAKTANNNNTYDKVNEIKIQNRSKVNVQEEQTYEEEINGAVMHVFRTFAQKWSLQFAQFVNSHSSIHEQESIDENENNISTKKERKGYDNKIMNKHINKLCVSREIDTKTVRNAAILHYLSPIFTLLMHILNGFIIHEENNASNVIADSNHKEDCKSNLSSKKNFDHSDDNLSHSLMPIRQELTNSLNVCHNVWMHSILIREFTCQLNRLLVESIIQLKEFIDCYGTNMFITHQLVNSNNNNNKKMQTRSMSKRDVKELIELFYSERVRTYIVRKSSNNTTTPSSITSTQINFMKANKTEGKNDVDPLQQKEENQNNILKETINTKKEEEVKKSEEVVETYRVVYKPTPELLFLLLDLRSAVLFLTDGHLVEDTLEKTTSCNSNTKYNKTNIKEDNYKRNAIFNNLPSTLHIPVNHEIVNAFYDNLEESVVECVESYVLPTITQTLENLCVSDAKEENTQRDYNNTNKIVTSENSETRNNDNNKDKFTTMSSTSSSVFCYVYEQFYFDLCVLQRAFAHSHDIQPNDINKLASVPDVNSTLHHLLQERIVTEFMENNSKQDFDESRCEKCKREVEIIQSVIMQEVRTLEDESGTILGLREFQSEQLQGQQELSAKQTSLLNKNANATIIKKEENKVSKYSITPETTEKTNLVREIPRFQLLPLPADTSMETLRKR